VHASNHQGGKGLKILIGIPLTVFFLAILASEMSGGVAPTYELYSWPDSNGGWNFCMLYTTNRQKTAEEVFNAKTAMHGLNEIKRKMSELPKGSRIVWFDRLTLAGAKVKETETLQYPPNEIVEELKRWAAKREIKLFGPGADVGQNTIDSRSLEVLGFTLGQNEAADVEAKLGKARTSHAPDHDMTQRCYQSKGVDHTAVVFEDWSGTLSGFRIYRADESDRHCTLTPFVTAELSTASGLKLGLNREKVLQILGKPTNALRNRLLYKRESQRPMTAEEVARFKRAYPGENNSDLTVFITTEIKLSFRSSKLSSIDVIQTETT
jgi:hypothetical protein